MNNQLVETYEPYFLTMRVRLQFYFSYKSIDTSKPFHKNHLAYSFQTFKTAFGVQDIAISNLECNTLAEKKDKRTWVS